MTNTTKSLGFIDLHTDYDFDKYIAWAECVTFSRIERVHVRINILHKIIVYCCHDTAVGATNENMNAEKNFAVEFMWKLHHLSYGKKEKKQQNNRKRNDQVESWRFWTESSFQTTIGENKNWTLKTNSSSGMSVFGFVGPTNHPINNIWCWCMHETENVFDWKYKSPFIQIVFERHTLAGTNKINKIYEKIKKKTLNISRERWNSFIYR